MEYLVEFLLLGVGLAMDAFAVSICKGLAMRKVNKKQAVIIALFFGGFQAIMPVIGWLLCKGFQTYIEAFDHCIAPDTNDTTYHIELRYGSDLEVLGKYDEGDYAYWLGSGISTDYDQTMVENCIELFCKENLSE